MDYDLYIEGPVNPRLYIDELHRLRIVERDSKEVAKLANWLWDAWRADRVPEPSGLGACCQAAFIALMEGGRAAEAQLWRARATLAAAEVGEPNTTAIMLVPLAFETRNRTFPVQAADVEAALDIMKLLGQVADELDARKWSGPGVSIEVLRRAQFEKSGYMLWRAARYREALGAYQAAKEHTPDASRDRLRIVAGITYAELGLAEDASGQLDCHETEHRFSEHLDEARAGGWEDIAAVFAENVSRAREGVGSVQDLLPLEVENRSARTLPSEPTPAALD